MTFRNFLDASYALMAEEHQRIDPFRSLSRVSEELRPATAGTTLPRVQNESSMSALKGMLSNVQNNPTKKPRKT